MLRRSFRKGLMLGLLVGIAVAVSKLLERRDDELLAASAPAPSWPPLSPAAPAAWVDPVYGVCPASHPVKAKLSSNLFHLPGMLAYERTKPDRCYLDPAAAEADGLTKAKR